MLAESDGAEVLERRQISIIFLQRYQDVLGSYSWQVLRSRVVLFFLRNPLASPPIICSLRSL